MKVQMCNCEPGVTFSERVNIKQQLAKQLTRTIHGHTRTSTMTKDSKIWMNLKKWVEKRKLMVATSRYNDKWALRNARSAHCSQEKFRNRKPLRHFKLSHALQPR